MKKLLIMLSAAALATGAFAETATVTTGTEKFEGFDAGINITTNTLTPNTVGEYLWYSAGDADEGETGTVTAYAEGDAKPANGDDSNANYLNVSTTTGTPLYRTVSSHSGTAASADENPVDIADGIFVDTYVQFSGSESAPSIPEGSKLVVWVQAIDEDPSEGIEGSTNLVVTSAMLDASGVPTATNFVIETAAEFDFEGWHRLTIRAIKDITTDTKIAGFTVFVDGVQLAAKATQIAGSDAVIENEVEVTPAVLAVTYNNLMGAYDYDTNLTMEAKKFYDNRQLFVSLVRNDNLKAQTLSAVGFDGTGKVDDVTVSDDRSQFAFARGDFYFTMEWDAGITGFTLTANDKAEGAFTQTYTKTGAGSEVIVIPAAATTLTISAIGVADGSTYNGSATIEVALLEETSYSLVTETTYVKIGDKSYSSFAAALADATAGATLKLVKPLSLSQTVVSGDIVLDLAGQTITYVAATLEDDVATEDVDESTLSAVITVAEGASLKIIDSVGEGMIQYEGEPDMFGSALIDAYSGTFILGDADDDADTGATIVGLIGDSGKSYADAEGGAYAQYVRGKVLYIDSCNGEYDADSGTYSAYFSPCLYVDGEDYTSSLECDGEYFVITPPTSGEPEPATFAVTVLNENTNASFTSDPATLTGLAAGTPVTITATANDGYTYNGATLGDWTIDENDATKATYTVTVNDNLTVTVPTAVAAEKEIEAGTTESFDTIEDAKAATNGVVITVSSTDAAAGISADYFKPVITPNGNTFVVGVDLDETVIQPSADDAAETFIENLATAEVVNGIITIKFTGAQVKKGLKYGVAVSESLTGENSIQNATPETWETANDSGVDLKVTKPTNGKGFFKVHIKYEPIKAAE